MPSASSLPALTAHLTALKEATAKHAHPLTYDPVAVAAEIRRLHKAGKPRAALAYYDTTVGNHGIEGLILRIPGVFSRVAREWLYSNTGETYDTTLILSRGSLWLGCWGDIAERYPALDTFTP